MDRLQGNHNGEWDINGGWILTQANSYLVFLFLTQDADIVEGSGRSRFLSDATFHAVGFSHSIFGKVTNRDFSFDIDCGMGEEGPIVGRYEADIGSGGNIFNGRTTDLRTNDVAKFTANRGAIRLPEEKPKPMFRRATCCSFVRWGSSLSVSTSLPS
jgi:hypothetical protein